MDAEQLGISTLLAGTIRMATPLIFAALGGLLSERAGIVQIGLEGMMLMGALAGAIAAFFSGSPWLGFFAAGFAGMLVALVMAFFVLRLKTDQIITGTALNILATGVAPFVTKLVFNSTGATPSLALNQRFEYAPLVMMVAAVSVVSFWYAKTRSGMWVQFAGEAPQALQVSGVNVAKVRCFALLSCGFLAGLGGGTLSLFLASAYSPNMTSGRGFMALAALIFGRWRPLPTALACVLFGLMEALQIRLQGGDSGIPVQLVQILPYLVTIIALAGFFGHSRPPKALGNGSA